MAEGWLKELAEDKAEIRSAGMEAHGLNPRAVTVMAEAGIDISTQTSDLVNKYSDQDFDFLITVCDSARERCPHFPAQTQKLHQRFPDPAKARGTEEDILREFRRVRDLIKDFCDRFVREKL